MLKHILHTIASLFTLVGGHFLNRRLDRAVLFFAVFVLSLLGIYYAMFAFLAGSNVETYMGWYQTVLKTMAYVGFGLLVLSAIVTFIDSSKNANPYQTHWSISGRVGAILMSFMGLLGAGYLVMLMGTVKMYTSDVDVSGEVTEEGSSFSFMTERLHASAHYGSTRGYILNAKSPPEGEGYLMGVIEYEGQPVSGLSLDIMLNDEYEAQSVSTDEQGRFVLRLPKGQWHVNFVTATSWKNKPKGSFVLVTGEESKLSGGHYSFYTYDNDVNKGKAVEIGDSMPTAPQLRLTLRKKITLLTPNAQDTRVQLSVADDAIRWAPLPDMYQYRVEIMLITRKGKGFTSMPMVYRTVSGELSELPLRDFKTTEREGTNNEYAVKVTAFNEEGRYLTESEGSFWSGYTFQLNESRVFIDEKYGTSTVEHVSGKQFETQFNNRNRLSAIELLIKEKMYSPAKTLLDGLDGKDVRPGRKSVLLGFWYASQGKCEQAIQHFTQAREEGGEACVTSEYMKGCP